ncbi:uncharacterized protein B0H64DRAFT_410218 [Chaetomium fimeti]|uniref:Uncharacterized protein n=1 Tax=Chaetomium fimeti TaxID=1854472 RepID=A0AAE0H962_9PEZI|nr:hypothetical protein B0H64DRAFT_410218 [Chaetomium fimeti]
MVHHLYCWPWPQSTGLVVVFMHVFITQTAHVRCPRGKLQKVAIQMNRYAKNQAAVSTRQCLGRSPSGRRNKSTP